MSDPVPNPLPLAGAKPERGDAAANRVRILEAAGQLLADHGVDGLTMDAVAAAAGVGKGTVFRRFGDRAGLTHALLDAAMRDFQDAFLSGPPPLGPGAPPAERLEAFVSALIARQVGQLELALAAESLRGEALPPTIATLMVHVESLVGQINPALNARVVTGLIMSSIAPPMLHRLRVGMGADTDTLQRSAIGLLRGLTS